MPRKKEWSEFELEKLNNLYNDNKATIEDMMLQLPGRTANAIRLKSSRLGLSRPVIDGFVTPSELRWTTHDQGNRSSTHEDSLSLLEAIAGVMEGADVAATGYRGRKAEMMITRGDVG